MIKKHTLLTVLFLVVFSSLSYSQSNWSKAKESNNFTQQKDVLYKKNFPKKYTLMNLQLNEYKNQLAQKSAQRANNIIQLPDANGNLKTFKVKHTSYLAPNLAAKFPMITSYSAQGIDDPTATAKISFGTDGMHAVVFSANEGAVYIDPYDTSNKKYIVYNRKSLEDKDDEFSCDVKESLNKKVASNYNQRNADDGKLRTYRIAIVCSGEYAQFHLNRQGVPAAASDTEKKTAVLSAMNTSMTRINGVYERDLGVNMVIIDDNDKIIFLDQNTDNITDGDAGTMINEVQTICDNQIGNANYDIGHIFSIGGSGLAGLGVVCVDGQKARGVTGIATPVGDPYDIDYVSHEIGHQFGATHTQNNNCNRTSSTAVEPGSASTIMGYAGICSPNVQNNSDDHFHAVSIAQMWSHVQNVSSCGTTTDTGNTAPTANAGSDYSIPKSTPFVLRGSATDVDGVSSLTYNWEQIDNEIGTMPPVATNAAGPMFRSLPSKTSPNRYMPALSTVIAGNTATTWEVLPSVARELNFALTVRDNNAGGGNTARDDVKISVTDAEAFTVTAPTTAVSWDTGSSQTITWNKGTTDQAPINCANVNIKLSTDGGLTFPITIKANTPNDGTETIQVPNNPSATVRIMVEAADNVFYNVNSTNFTINSTEPTFLLANNTEKQTTCNNANTDVTYNLSLDFINGFTETATLSATGLPTGANATFNPTTLNVDGDVTMTVSGLNGATQGEYTIEVKAESATKSQTVDALLNLLGTDFATATLTAPANSSTGISITPTFMWSADNNANEYVIEIASDNTFNTIVANATVATNSYTLTASLAGTTKYYWRVKSKNSCGEGSYSTASEFTTEVPSYCASAFTQSDNSEFISNVTFNTINNDSGNDHDPTADDGYQDFTSISTNVRRTSEHQISVTLNTAGFQDHCYVFIDWNQDFQFDKATERYDLGLQTDDVATTTMNITVPNNAVLGSTRMRVLIEYADPNDGNGDGACTSDHKSGWGETEDYTIVVEEAPQPHFTLTNNTGDISICNKAVSEQVFEINYETFFNFNEEVTLTATGLPTNAVANFSNSTLNANETVNLTISNLNNATPGNYTVKVTGTSNSITKDIEFLFYVNDDICKSNGTEESQISTTKVQFANIDNSSTKTNGYSDFTSINNVVTIGQTYQLNTEVNTDGKNTKTYAWIDWNQNCVFDANEQYDLGTLTNATGATSNSGLEITVPANALTGSTTLRITTKNSDKGDPMSCEINFDGEVEDYTVSIIPDYSITNTTGAASICNKTINEVVYSIDYKTINSFNEDVALSFADAPTNATVTLSTTSINTDGNFTVTVANLNNVTNGDYTIKLTGTSSITKTIDLRLVVNDNICKSNGNGDSDISTTNVTFGNINNTSTKETAGYSDFTAMSTEVIKGETYQLSTNVNTAGQSTKTYAWIDWNQNCVFDADEQYDLGTLSNATGATSNSGLNITIPADALTGSTTLRVTTKNSAKGDPMSCELDFDGEVEDYTITITPDFTIANTTGSGSICNKAINEFVYTINYNTFNDFSEEVTLSATDVPANATVTISPTNISATGTFTVTVANLNNVTVGDYTINLTASSSITKNIDLILSVNDNICKSSGNNDSQLSITNVAFGDINNASTKTTGYSDFKSISTEVVRGESYNLDVTINAAGNTLAWVDWNQNCLFDANEQYDVTNPIVVPEDALLGATTIRISTKANSNPNSCELDFDGEVEDYTINIEESFATSATLFKDLNMWPVPTIDNKLTVKFKVKSKDLTIVRLFDLTGQLLDTQSFSTVSSSFNKEIQFSNFIANGIYLIQIENAGATKTRKIILK
ncbi:MAG: GEVED domain-containing protein [Tenacibaculum sp.]